MNRKTELAFLSFIELQKDSFTFDDVMAFFEKLNICVEPEEIRVLLSSMPFLVEFEDDTYCSKDIVLEDVCFSILPTKKEIDEGYLIIGHRTMPFTNQAMMPSELTFYVGRKIVPKTEKALPNSEIRKHYEFFGEDYMVQVLGNDIVNMNEPFDNILNPELYTTKLTVLDMKKFYEKYKFHYGDRIICTSRNWFEGTINIAPYSAVNDNTFNIEEFEQIKKIWTGLFEKNLATVLKKHGVLANIYEQLFSAVMEDIKHFSNPFYSSIEEVLDASSLFEIQPFGVESRIWFKGQEIIAIKKWDSIFTLVPLTNENLEDYGIAKCIMIHLNDFIIQAYIKDAIFNNENDIQNVINKIIPDFIPVKSKDLSYVLANLETKYTELKKEYSKFADYPIAEIRHGALEILTDIINLAHEIRLSTISPETMQQQPLIMMMHLVEHISKLLCIFLEQPELSEEELFSMKDSIQGMRMSFDENQEIIMDELHARHNNLTLSFSGDNKNGK